MKKITQRTKENLLFTFWVLITLAMGFLGYDMGRRTGMAQSMEYLKDTASFITWNNETQRITKVVGTHYQIVIPADMDLKYPWTTADVTIPQSIDSGVAHNLGLPDSLIGTFDSIHLAIMHQYPIAKWQFLLDSVDQAMGWRFNTTTKTYEQKLY